MTVGQMTSRATRTVRGFEQIDYPALEPRPWNEGREDVIEVGPARGLPSWANDVIARFSELHQRAANWDRRGGRVLNLDDANDALNFLVSAMGEESPLPQITALPSGGVELHWRVGDTDLEVVFDSTQGERIALLDVGEDEHEMPPETAVHCVDFLGERLAIAA